MGYRPLAIHDFVFETGSLFNAPPGVEAFGSRCATAARSKEERYRLAHDLMREVIRMAHERGIQVAIGFEFGIHPPELASIVPPESRIGGAMLPDPTHSANIEILLAALSDLVREYPGLDWVWLWLHEHTMHVGKPQLSGRFSEFYKEERRHFSDAPDEQTVFTGIWSLAHIRQAHEYLARRAPKVRMAISGWGGGAQLPPVLRGLDRALPREIVFTCLNPGLGSQGHLPVLAHIARNRPTWSIPWLEGDGALWHLQPRVGMMIEHVRAAHRDGLAGVLAIHWRTEEVRENLEAFAEAVKNPRHLSSVEEFYRREAAQQYGPESTADLAPLLARMDHEQWLAELTSPEFYPYQPGWGRLSLTLVDRLKETITVIERVSGHTANVTHKSNLDWLADNLRFTLLLDEVGRKIEPAYRLKEEYLMGKLGGTALRTAAESARNEFNSAPIERLFRVYARRVRSRGELGELSSLNQKLWLQYRELQQFLNALDVNRSQ